MPTWLRLGLGLSGGVLAVLLAVAAWLDPDPRRYGTHQQLGLPPCTIEALYAMRCPSCGMTTSWAEMMRGRPLRSLQANAGGTLLALAALPAAPWLIVSACRGRWWGGALNEWIVVAGAVLITLVTLIDWGLRVAGLL